MEITPARRIIVERVRIDDLGSEFNSNNHPRDGDDDEANALDYQQEHRKTNLLNYAHLVDYPIAWSYKFTPEECLTLRECALKGQHLRSAQLYVEELTPIIERLKRTWDTDETISHGMWFFRFNSCSPKDGVGEYPVWNPSQVINMIATSRRGWEHCATVKILFTLSIMLQVGIWAVNSTYLFARDALLESPNTTHIIRVYLVENHTLKSRLLRIGSRHGWKMRFSLKLYQQLAHTTLPPTFTSVNSSVL